MQLKVSYSGICVQCGGRRDEVIANYGGYTEVLGFYCPNCGAKKYASFEKDGGLFEGVKSD